VNPFAAAARIPQAGAVVTTIVDGKKQVHEAGQPPQPIHEETTMPRGVYERKPKNPATAAGKPTKKRKGRHPGHPAATSYADLLAGMRSRREKLTDEVAALGTAIEALEALG
jgi:hypothetical protein